MQMSKVRQNLNKKQPRQLMNTGGVSIKIVYELQILFYAL